MTDDLKKKLLRLRDIFSERAEAVKKRDEALKRIESLRTEEESILLSNDFGVGPNRPERFILISGQLYRIKHRVEAKGRDVLNTISIEPLEVLDGP